MKPFTFNIGTLDRSMPELIEHSIRFVARGYKSDAAKDALFTMNRDSTDIEESSYAWLGYIFNNINHNNYTFSKYTGGIRPEPMVSPYYDSHYTYNYLADSPPASLKSLMNFLVVYQDVIKYEKNWVRYYRHACSPLKEISAYLESFLSQNINEVLYPRTGRMDGGVYSYFIPHGFIYRDVEVPELLELAVHGGLTTRNMLYRNEKFTVNDYWIFSCLTKSELTEKFVYDYLTLTRKPTHFGQFNVWAFIYGGYNNAFRLNPNFQKARSTKIVEKIKKLNSYRLEMISDLICIFDSTDPFAVDLMSLQLEHDIYQRAKGCAETILLADKVEYDFKQLGKHPPLKIIDVYKQYIEDERLKRVQVYKEAYDARLLEAINSIANTFVYLWNVHKNEKYFGISDWTWNIADG